MALSFLKSNDAFTHKPEKIESKGSGAIYIVFFSRIFTQY